MKGYRTVIFNAIMAVVAIGYAMNPDAEKPTAEQVQGAVDTVQVAIGAVTAVGNVLLRMFTNSPIFKKE